MKPLVSLLRGLAWDVGVPVAAYYLLRAFGASEWVALLASTLASGARVVWVAARERTFNLFATVMMLVFGLGLALAFVAGDPRFLLLKASFVSAAVGLVFLVTAVRGNRPLTVAAEQTMNPGQAEVLEHEFLTDPDVRRGHRIASAVWGVGLIAEALVRIPLIYLIPLDVMVGVSVLLQVATFVGLAVWTVRFAARRGSAPDDAVTGES